MLLNTELILIQDGFSFILLIIPTVMPFSRKVTLIDSGDYDLYMSLLRAANQLTTS